MKTATKKDAFVKVPIWWAVDAHLCVNQHLWNSDIRPKIERGFEKPGGNGGAKHSR
jgi:hypothetical protein